MVISRLGSSARMGSSQVELVVQEGIVSPVAHMAGPKVDTDDAMMVILE